MKEDGSGGGERRKEGKFEEERRWEGRWHAREVTSEGLVVEVGPCGGGQ